VKTFRHNRLGFPSLELREPTRVATWGTSGLDPRGNGDEMVFVLTKMAGQLVQSLDSGLDIRSGTRNCFPCLRIRHGHHEVPPFSLSVSHGGGPMLASVISSTRL